MKFVITWDIGDEEHRRIIEADNQDEANGIAYQLAKEEFEEKLKHQAVPLNSEMGSLYGDEDRDD
jgi:hypothetical protein